MYLQLPIFQGTRHAKSYMSDIFNKRARAHEGFILENSQKLCYLVSREKNFISKRRGKGGGTMLHKGVKKMSIQLIFN